LDRFPLMIDVNDIGGRREALGDRRQVEEEREVQRSIDAHNVVGVAGVTADKLGDLVFAVEHFTIREEVLFPDAQPILPHRVAEGLNEVPFNELQRVNTKAIDVIAGYEILIGENERITYRKNCPLLESSDEFLERLKVAAFLAALAFTPEESIALQL